ncbi:MAG: LLM class flavin-dependent oxidoreductase [Alphaproteobacteria bacterium]
MTTATLEIIGWVAPRVSSEMIPAEGPPFDAEVIARTARVHEAAGFDRVLIGYFSDAPDGFMVGACAAAATQRLQFLLAHRPGFVAPTVAARKLATLDQLSGGRLAVHIISGGSDVDQAKDGDFVDHAGRYRRSEEYVGLLRRAWTEPAPIDHDGEFYRIVGSHADIRCHQQPHIPIYGGGGSDAAIESLAPHLDCFMLWGEPLAETAAFMDRVRQAAAKHGRTPTFSLSTRPILADTEEKAWARAHGILDRIQALRGGQPAPPPENIGSQRLLNAAAAREVHDTCLWTRLAVATGARGNSTALVGTPETVAKAMLEYYKLGATSLLIRGYDPLPDAVQYGEELIPRVRELVAELS